jgi:hypothetical protein
MAKSEQVLTFREAPICIDTAHGVIEIHRIAKNRRSVRILLPSGLRAHIGMAHVQKRSNWVEINDGKEKPKHRILEVICANGGFEVHPLERIRVMTAPEGVTSSVAAPES